MHALPVADPVAEVETHLVARWPILVIVMAALVVRAMIVGDARLTAIGYAGHDDAWFLERAEFIFDHWMGKYDQMTLIKGPGYPLFIGLSSALGLSLRVAHTLLYMAACLIFFSATSPLLRNWRWRIALLLVLLFNPMSFNTGQMGRIVREAIYPAQTLLLVAFAAGLSLRRDASLRRQLPWAVGLGLSFGWFWITREEAVWMVPTVALLLVPWLWHAMRTPAQRLGRIGLAAATCALALAPIHSVCLANYLHYGIYCTVEFRHRDFIDAYSALSRIHHEKSVRLVPVPADARAKAYVASPTFARLKPHLEGDVGQTWKGISKQAARHVTNDFTGGLFMWALRDAAQKSESFASAAEAMSFYRQCADEINAACDRGEIPAGPRRFSMAAPFDRAWLGFAGDAYAEGIGRVLHFSVFNPEISPSIGDPARLKWVRQITNSKPASADNKPKRSGLQYTCRRWLGLAYSEATTTLTVIGLAALLFTLPRRLRESRMLLLILVALLGAIAFRLAILSWIQATAFSAMNDLYLSPLFPLLLLILILSLAATFGGGQAPLRTTATVEKPHERR